RLDLPQHIAERAAEIPGAYELLGDEKSRLEFVTQIYWRFRMDYSRLPPHDPPADMYFPRDLFSLSPDEVFVDCGAFDGDSLRSFSDRVNGRFRRIYAFEPDADNRAALSRHVAALPADAAAKIAILPYALGRTDGTVRFSANGAVNSKVVA